MVVLLTIGLSLISHSVTDISISKDEEEAMRAFSTAEAGIEEALRQSGLGTSWTGGRIDVGDEIANVTVGPNTGAATRNMAEGEFMNIDLKELTANTDLTISWTKNSDTADNAALEVVIYQTDGIAKRSTYSETGTCAQGFDSADPAGVIISIVEATDDLIRIRALCNGTTVTVSSVDLPVQEYIIDSRAAVGSVEKSKTSAIKVTKRVDLPPIFDYVLFTRGNL